ncbi:hypothetical protein R70723_11680 [Paenibacillus sp. FSL R7-0273]|uniref:DUF2812 domain-containing protein n=1 Tax=Paenibacillus sp. FSL R7-0273 TaxID=1536772 RepID=UPI0004F899B1|nr:DUF2812 domain-containing protein [Paenibacillus sp. FSL R7-0273]AIQ46459.1 hypothetical protein R70723_11680 [Paenibacillus sp. FSL R7-0273]OMF86797.1 hypothetical protein BK144_25565 [Paenibacillus sp. FSL R7-0273]
MKTVFRPFWSYDLHRTEAWLTEMAAQGWMLAGWNLRLRTFSFRQDTPVHMTWQIGYERSANTAVPAAMAAAGWRKHLQQGKWSVYTNPGQPEALKAYPSRKELLKRSRTHTLFFTGITVYAAVIFIIPLTLLTASVITGTPVRVVKSPMWLVTGLAGVALLLLLIAALISMHKIRAESRHFYGDNGRAQKVETPHMSTGRRAVRLRLGWMYSPDRLEKWLEAQERRGYNLYKVGRLGTIFYFIKGSPRLVNYHADYQLAADPDYFELHRSAGWKNRFSTSFSTRKWTIWSKEYDQGEEPPQMYSDPFHRLKHARRIAMYYTLLFLPMLLLYSLNLTVFIGSAGGDGANPARLTNILLMLVSVIIFGSFVSRTWLYYRRLKISLN